MRHGSDFAGPCLWVVTVFVALDSVSELPGATEIAVAALLLFLVATWRSAGRVGRLFMLGSALSAGMVLLFGADPDATLHRGLKQACNFAALFTVLGFIREPARSSPLVLATGTMLIQQPPGRRYSMLTLGSHLFGVILNFGVVGMLGVMITRSNRSSGSKDAAGAGSIRQRRAMLAIMRGYAAVMAWSPLTVGIAVVLSALPGLTYDRLAPVGLTIAAATMGLGWALDRFEGRHLDGRADPGPAMPLDVALLARMSSIIGVIVIGIAATAVLLQLRVIEAVTLVVVPAGLIWLAVQYGRRGLRAALRYAGLRLLRWTRDTLPHQSRDTAILCCAGFLGVTVSALMSLVNAQALADQVPAPAIVLPVAAFWSVIALGQIGVTPIVAVTMLGAILPHPEAIGIPVRLLLTAYLGGWVLTSQLSPFTANTLTVAHLCGTEAATVTCRWNGLYARVAIASGTLFLVLVGQGMAP